jgi:hypothetical protein
LYDNRHVRAGEAGIEKGAVREVCVLSCQQMGHRLLPAIVDVEASGFGAGSYPIEVGFVLPDGSPHCKLIKPAPQWTHWDASAERLHNIPRRIIEHRGEDIRKVCIWLNEHLRGQTVYSDAWGNDMSWLALLFDEAEMPQLFVIDALTKLLSNEQMNAWAMTRQEVFDRIKLQRHRASTDARVIQMTYFYSLKKVNQEMPPSAADFSFAPRFSSAAK